MQRYLGSLSDKDRRSEVIATELGYLWANLLQRGVTEGHRAIGFCAIGEDEGASALAVNLALFAGAKGKKTALVEASMRSPSMAEIFETTASPGLAETLQGKAALGDVVRRQIAPGLDLVPAGESDDPFWSFTTDGFRRVLHDLIADHDICLIDVPALNRAPEASLVVRSLGAVVLAVQANRHRLEAVRRNVGYLRSLGTPFLGVVLTDLVHVIPRPVARIV